MQLTLGLVARPHIYTKVCMNKDNEHACKQNSKLFLVNGISHDIID